LPYFLVWFPGFVTASAVAIAMNLVLRLILALKYRQPAVTSVLLHPIGIAATIFVGIHSFFCYQRGRVRWKGREVKLGKAVASP
jgi:hypothetical protein